MILARDKRCEQCGRTFECGGLFGCWCRGVKLDAATLAKLRDSYADCLCPGCLGQAAQQPPGQSAVSDKSVTVTDSLLTDR
jgi:hypothetical protein